MAEHLTVVSHPLVQHKLTLMREKDTSTASFRQLLREISLRHWRAVVTKEALVGLANALHARTGLPDLCFAGGVALNSVANGRIVREGPFKNVFIQPAAGDSGGALGASTKRSR